MQKRSIIFITQIILISSLFSNSATAGDLEWSGVYRIEGNHLLNSELGDRDKVMGYGLHHLVLRPKIVVGDGLTIFGQFNLLNNAGYPNSQMGQFFGAGVRDGAARTGTTTVNDSDSLSQNQRADTLQVSQLYLTYAHEYGQLIAGRAPIHFGLGMTHNAGRGLFDHWYDTRDLVGYKFLVGNLYFLPMIGKASEGDINNASDDVTDYMLQVQYENPETDTELGVFVMQRKGADQASDGPDGAAGVDGLGDPTSVASGKVDSKLLSIYALRDTERFRLGLEATFESGESGVVTNAGAGDNVAWGGFGLAFEAEYRPLESKWIWGLKAGSASGDDPGTSAKFEGFLFDRNYDVAMLMFNHPLGRADFLRTKLITGNVYDGTGAINRTDVETISNAVYVAPTARYAFSDRWSMDNTIIAGYLATNPLAGFDVANDLGYEWDISLNFTPRKGVMWINQAGFLFPGDAWKGDGQYDSSFGFGLTTKAAISF